MDQYELLIAELNRQGGQNSGISAGQVLLINKENKEHNSISSRIGDMGLKANAISGGYKTPFLHSVIVSKIEGKEIYIRHSTMKGKDGGMGIEEKKYQIF